MAYTSRPIYLFDPAVQTPEMQVLIDPFLTSWLEKHAMGDGANLFHYTDLNGLKGILKQRGFWLSHTSSLNDPSELKYGKELVLKLLDEQILDEDDTDMRSFYNSIKVSVSAFGMAMHEIFIACFCESGNLLSQWRAYSNQGGGYSLGFNLSNSSRIWYDKGSLQDGIKPLLRKVIYDPELQKELVLNYLILIKEGYEQGIRGIIDDRMDRNHHAAVMGSQASNMLLDFVMSFKNPAFSEEKEWRLIHVTLDNDQPEKLQFREGKNGLIPYKQSYLYNSEEESHQFPLSSICLGPSIEPESQKKAIRLYLFNSTTQDDLIKMDNPYRITISTAGYGLI